jgi:hypothetical protein
MPIQYRSAIKKFVGLYYDVKSWQINVAPGTRPYKIVQDVKVHKGLKSGNPDLASKL